MAAAAVAAATGNDDAAVLLRGALARVADFLCAAEHYGTQNPSLSVVAILPRLPCALHPIYASSQALQLQLQEKKLSMCTLVVENTIFVLKQYIHLFFV